MTEIALQIAGLSGAGIAVVHAWLGDARVVTPFRSGAPDPAFRVMRAIMALSGLYWLALGCALIAAPYFASEAELRVLALVAAFAYATGAIGNAWAMRGRHFGAYLLLAPTTLALYGALA
ncbi:MAG: hypothetical protein AAFU55_02650 [Pseudomonadota bacterium]